MASVERPDIILCVNNDCVSSDTGNCSVDGIWSQTMVNKTVQDVKKKQTILKSTIFYITKNSDWNLAQDCDFLINLLLIS